MIFLDANVFLRYLTEPETPEDHATHLAATVLLEAVERGEEEVTTSEAVLAEVAFILSAKRHYNRPPADVAAYLKPLIGLTNLRMGRGQKRLYIRALDLWSAHPRLGFVDALTAVTVAQTDVMLATFDSDFDGLPDITHWQPPDADGGGDAR